jgi:hypothetical protein
MNDYSKYYPLIDKLATEDFARRHPGNVKMGFSKRIDFQDGGKLIKMVSVDLNDGVENEYGRSVYGFIVKEDNTIKSATTGAFFKAGDLLKAAGWKAPAKNFARGNIHDLNDDSKLPYTGIG